MSRSRLRRGDRNAVRLACAIVMLVPLTAWLTVQAKADPSTPVAVYAARNADPICETIADYPSIAGVTGVVSGVMEDGNFTAYESGQVIGLAVSAACPEYWPVLQRFIEFYSANPDQNYVA